MGFREQLKKVEFKTDAIFMIPCGSVSQLKDYQFCKRKGIFMKKYLKW